MTFIRKLRPVFVLTPFLQHSVARPLPGKIIEFNDRILETPDLLRTKVGFDALSALLLLVLPLILPLPLPLPGSALDKRLCCHPVAKSGAAFPHAFLFLH